MRSRTIIGRRVAVVAVGVLAVLLPACTPATVPPAGITSCAWAVKTDPSALNVAYPDTAATYWTTTYNLVAGDTLVLSGTYPDARYMSLITYTAAGNVVDAIDDRNITPTAGSGNPFSDTAASAGGQYTVEVRPDVAIGSPDNVLNPGGVLGSVIYRVYVGNGNDPTGAAPLPSLSVKRTDGTVVPIPTCANPGTDPALLDLINAFGPATDAVPQTPPVFTRPANVGGLYANPANGYVAAVADHAPGRVLVVTGQAPSVPDTETGVSPAAAAQLRYWSLCANEYRKPYPVSSCLHDTQVPVDGSGNYTIAVSTAVDRPANATVADGAAWLDWGSTSQNMLLLMRHMLPDASFTESVFAVAPGASAEAMGAYRPVVKVCTTASFEAAGNAC